MGSHSFSISDCANNLGPTAEPRHVFAALRRLQSSNELEFALDTSEAGRVFHLKAGLAMFRRDDYDEMEEHLVSTIFESFSSSSYSGATKLLDMHYVLDEVARASLASVDADGGGDDVVGDDDDDDSSLSLSRRVSPSLLRFQELTRKYFGKGLESERRASEGLLPASFSTINEKELKIDVLSLQRDLPPLFQQISKHQVGERPPSSEADPPVEYLKLGDLSTIDYTVLAITKFLHGMDTPRTPISIVRHHPMFGKWKSVDFRLVHESIRKLLDSQS